MDPWDINPNYRLAIWKELLDEIRKARQQRAPRKSASKTARKAGSARECCA